MQFALFYEIPVAKPWDADSEHLRLPADARAGRRRRAPAAGTRSGRSSTTSSRSTRTARTPRCSTARSRRTTERMRLGYGVRLMPKPYNHPVRTAESVAVLDLISNGRVDFGTGRSATRSSSRASASTRRTRARCGRRRSSTSSAAGRTRSTSSKASTGRCRSVACSPSRCQSPHPPIFGATRATRGTRRSASWASACARSPSAFRPEEVKHKIDIYREAIAKCTTPIGEFVQQPGGHVHDGDRARRRGRGPRSRRGSRSSGTRRSAHARSPQVADWMEERRQELGNYGYAADMRRSTTTAPSTCSASSTSWTRGLRARHAGTVHRGVQAVRGGRRRSAALPGQPVQDPARQGDADHRADGHAR